LIIMTRTLPKIAVLCAALSPFLFASQITFKNGDRVSGAILNSDAKTLTIKSDLAGTINVPWDAVDAISSTEPLALQLKDGQTLVGAVTTSGGTITVQTAAAGTVATTKDAILVVRSKEGQEAYEAEIDRLKNPRLRDLWAGSVDAGIAGTGGNSETTTFNLGMNAARTTSRDKISVYLTSLYASNSTSGPKLVTAQATRGGFGYAFNITPRVYAFGTVDLEFDKFQKLDLRFVGGGGAGYHVAKSQRTMFDIFVGGDIDREYYSTGLDRSSAEVMVGDELTFKVSKRTSFHQKMTFFPNLTDSGQFRLNFDLSAVTNINKWLAWQATFSDRYLTNPLPGLKGNDVLYSTGIHVTFGPAGK
jgi:putative salt-induced outer membrane protein YdiY